MKKKAKALLDMDGVVVDFVRGVLKFHDRPDISYGDITWNLETLVRPDLTPSEFWETLGYDFWVNLPFTPKGDLLTKYVLQMFGPENVCICTSPCRTKGSIEGKIDWLRQHIPELSRRFMVTPVKEFAASQDRILIDDNDENCRKFREAGGLTILVNQPWNAGRDKLDAGSNYSLKDLLKEVDYKLEQ